MNSNERFQKRQDTLYGLANGVAAAISNRLTELKFDLKHPIEVMPADEFFKLNLRYWGFVQAFKDAHGFKKPGRINSPKKATLTILATMSNKVPLFTCKDTVAVENKILAYVYLRYAYEVMMLFMGIDSIDALKKSQGHRKYFNASLASIPQFDLEFPRREIDLWCLYVDVYNDEAATNLPSDVTTADGEIPLADDFDFEHRIPKIILI